MMNERLKAAELALRRDPFKPKYLTFGGDIGPPPDGDMTGRALHHVV